MAGKIKNQSNFFYIITSEKQQDNIWNLVERNGYISAGFDLV